MVFLRSRFLAMASAGSALFFSMRSATRLARASAVLRLRLVAFRFRLYPQSIAWLRRFNMRDRSFRAITFRTFERRSSVAVEGGREKATGQRGVSGCRARS